MSLAFVVLIFTVLSILYLFPSIKRSKKSKINYRKAAGLFWTTCALSFIIAMVMQPEVVFAGSTMGLKAWWNIVFPSLLPFFIASELLMSFGLVKFMGVLLEPVMRPLFNVPGCGSFVFCIGYTSGYPISAMVTARLRSEGLCTRIEAERLVCFTSNSSPLFMIVAVSVGMFGRPELAVVIAGSHYLANLTLGLMLRFYGRKDRERLSSTDTSNNNLIVRALGELTKAWQNENRPLGKIIGDAIRNSINNLLNIGGFIIIFSVLIRLFAEIGFIGHLADIFASILLPLGFSPEVMPSLASGFFEMTIGSKMASESSAPLIQQVAAAGIILAWSGLSAHAQVASMISVSDIRILPFVCSRVIHASLSALYIFLFFGPAMPLALSLSIPAMAAIDKMNQTPPLLIGLQSSGILVLAITGMMLLSFAVSLFHKLKFYL